jgi:DNA-binding NarL/FixJ family response regulator
MVVAGEDALLRDVVVAICSAGGLTVAGSTGLGSELVELCRSGGADVAVASTDMEDGQLEGFIGSAVEHVPVLVISDSRSPGRLVGLLAAGASGCLLNESLPEQVLGAVRVVASGRAVLDPAAADTVLKQWRHLRSGANGPASSLALTEREKEVLRAMADGHSAKSIARMLGIALKTVESHKSRLFDKLGVHNQAQAVALSIGLGLLAGQTAVTAGAATSGVTTGAGSSDPIPADPALQA